MKYKKRILTYVLLISLIINLIPLNVKADGVGSGWNAVSNVVVPTSFGDFTVSQGYNYISTFGGETLPSGINFYFSYADGKCYNITFDKVCTSVLNAKIGLTMSETILTGWLSAVLNYASNFGMNILNSPAWAVPCPLKPCVTYNSADDEYTLVGFALTPLDGCVYSIPPSGTDPTIDIPSNFTNWVKEFTDNYIDDEGLNAPDYINIGTVTENLAKNYANYNTSSFQQTLNYINSPLGDYMFNFCCLTTGSKAGKFYSIYQGNYETGDRADNFGYLNSYTDCLFVSDNNYNSFVNAFGLSADNNAVSVQDLISYTGSTNLYVNIYKNSQIQNLTFRDVTTGTDSTGGYDQRKFPVYKAGSKYICFSNKGFLTVYKEISIPNAISTNTYAPSFYTSNSYKNYSVSADNSLNTKVSNINNSVTTNTNIYNSSKNETNTNITNNNYQIDNSTNDNSVTTIINNYYGSSGGDDNGGGDDDNNDSIWDKLLEALGGLFDKLGDIITVVATGIISIFTTILNLIVEISTNFTTITDTLSAFFSWIPTEIMTPIILGVNLMILIILLNAIKR